MTARRYSYTTADGKRWLGATQAAMLGELVERKRWWRGCGWLWKHRRGLDLERMFERLTPLGLVDLALEPTGKVVRGSRILREVWRPTALGRRVARLIEAQDRRERAGQQAGRL